MIRPIYSQKKTRCPFYRRLGGSQCRRGIRSSDLPARSNSLHRPTVQAIQIQNNTHILSCNIITSIITYEYNTGWGISRLTPGWGISRLTPLYPTNGLSYAPGSQYIVVGGKAYTASQVRTSRSWDKGVLTDLCLTQVLTDLCLTLYIYIIFTDILGSCKSSSMKCFFKISFPTLQLHRLCSK